VGVCRAAARQLGNMMSTEFARRGLGVRVNTINPGYFPSVSNSIQARSLFTGAYPTHDPNTSSPELRLSSPNTSSILNSQILTYCGLGNECQGIRFSFR
jgi:NAD(P)-dependent dehydrogenase (short-subunit alcohol dehydrogenase family)